MRFPPKAYNKDLESAEVMREGVLHLRLLVDSNSSVAAAFRNVGNGSSRIWSLLKRWLKMMTTASRNAPHPSSVHLRVVTQNSLLHAVLFASNKTPAVFTSGLVGGVVWMQPALGCLVDWSLLTDRQQVM